MAGRLPTVCRCPRRPNEKPGPAHVHLYLVSLDGQPPRRLLGGDRAVQQVQWHPHGRLLCYLDRQGETGKLQVFALPMDGGEPYALTSSPTGVRAFAWRPDGRQLAYTAEDPPTDWQKEAERLGFKQVVVDEVWRNASLYLATPGTGTVTRLTTSGHVNSFIWSPDGKFLVAAISPRGTVDDTYMFQRLHAVYPEGPRVEKLVDNPGKLGGYALSPDGKFLAYISAADRNDPHAGMLYLLDLATRQVRGLTEGLEGMVHQVHWLNQEKLRVALSRGVRAELATLDVRTGQWDEAAPAGPAFTAFEPLPTGLQAVMAASTAEHPPEVYWYDGKGFHRLTNSNPWLEDRVLGRQTVEVIPARDGLPIEGILMWPVGYDPAKKYPLVIVVHGGPESHFQNGWNTSYGRWGQLLAGRGYFVWHPNYRGSTGRGVAFAKADHGDVMGGEFRDHLDAIAEFARRGWIDPKRVGIGGGSYGGFTAAWAATRHSEHFAAAVSFVPVVDLYTKWFTTDIPWEFYYVHYQEKWPHQQEAYLRERSPLTYAPHCRTPLLLLGGTADTRVHPSQPFMLYRAVRFATQTPCRYIQYPGEPHGNRTNVYQYDFCVRTLRWFDHYLQPGDRRHAPLPPWEIDLGPWKEAAGQGASQ